MIDANTSTGLSNDFIDYVGYTDYNCQDCIYKVGGIDGYCTNPELRQLHLAEFMPPNDYICSLFDIGTENDDIID